jgi:HEAT repeat protein
MSEVTWRNSALHWPIRLPRLRRAVFLLGEKRAVETIKNLSRIIADESHPFLAEETAALGKIGDENALNALTAAARHRSFIVRARALEALAAAGGRWARLAIELAQQDPSAMVKEAAAGVRT